MNSNKILARLLAPIALGVFLLGTLSSLSASAQVVGNYKVPSDLALRILKAEDAREAEPVVAMLTNVNTAVRYRAALAAGRIGDQSAVDRLAVLLSDSSVEVRTMAAFALGEIESLKAADVVIRELNAAGTPDPVRARLVEAAGKIAAANAGPPNAPPESRNPKVTDLGNAILDTLEAEEAKRERQSSETVRLGLTAALRARPEGSDIVVALFLTNLRSHIRADAANTMARLRAKNANAALRGMLMNDEDPIARANAARALGAADDKESVNMLIVAAVEDDDSRVRVSAVRSLAALRDPFAVERLLEHGEKLLARVRTASGSDRTPRKGLAVSNPAEKSELLEIAAGLGRLVPKTNDARTVRFLTALGEADRYRSPETEIAFARVAPKKYSEYLIAKKPDLKTSRAATDAALQGIREFATLGTSDEEAELKRQAVEQLRRGLTKYKAGEAQPTAFAVPEILRSYAAFKPEGLDAELRHHLADKDVFVRAAAADLIADLPPSTVNANALRDALISSLQKDKQYNDAQLGLLDALGKVAGRNSISAASMASYAPDFLVRKKAAEVLKQFPGWSDTLTDRSEKWQSNVSTLKPYNPKSGTRLGQVLNTDSDYRRALARRNGSVKAVLTTQKGTFTIDLLPEDAPLTVDNFIKLARARYFDGLEVHRVVPNFVMQYGDPRGDGNGGPGWSIRCEVNMVPYERGAVGMALSGKDTGGSQWFVTHSQQPHLDGGYTVFGKVNEAGMKVVDKIVRGDKILSVRITETAAGSRRSKK